jgi:hypothetical protein
MGDYDQLLPSATGLERSLLAFMEAVGLWALPMWAAAHGGGTVPLAAIAITARVATTAKC